MLYAILKGMSTFVSWLPYKFVVRLGRNCGKLYYHIAKKQRVRAEKTIMERMGMEEKEAKETIYRLFLNLGMTFMEMLYMPALNKDNIRGLVTFDRPDVLWEALSKKKGVVMLACHMDNWEWLGAALALNGFPLSAVEKPQPNPVYSDFMNELRRGVGQEIFARGTNEILGCARAMKKGRMLGLIADQDGGYNGIFVPFLGRWLDTGRSGVFCRKFRLLSFPSSSSARKNGCGHRVFVKDPIITKIRETAKRMITT